MGYSIQELYPFKIGKSAKFKSAMVFFLYSTLLIKPFDHIYDSTMCNKELFSCNIEQNSQVYCTKGKYNKIEGYYQILDFFWYGLISQICDFFLLIFHNKFEYIKHVVFNRSFLIFNFYVK